MLPFRTWSCKGEGEVFGKTPLWHWWIVWFFTTEIDSSRFSSEKSLRIPHSFDPFLLKKKKDSLNTPHAYIQNPSEDVSCAVCVQRFDDSRLQFTPHIAVRCVLHRQESRGIHRQNFFFILLMRISKIPRLLSEIAWKYGFIWWRFNSMNHLVLCLKNSQTGNRFFSSDTISK